MLWAGSRWKTAQTTYDAVGSMMARHGVALGDHRARRHDLPRTRKTSRLVKSGGRTWGRAGPADGRGGEPAGGSRAGDVKDARDGRDRTERARRAGGGVRGASHRPRGIWQYGWMAAGRGGDAGDQASGPCTCGVGTLKRGMRGSRSPLRPVCGRRGISAASGARLLYT